ncbi:16S rRNA (cytosine(967)-C(5))-methyltransferase RsmB [Tissierella creatinini]|nr:16S rRNA (cytosine(967)-C(5))-methyltransferase RsmB [Tissierella creatinini]TJX69201.1 16S rRNA (cytosine(967)-C(5))-methyltransferase RsmB [Soehngenia saccharolytica]
MSINARDLALKILLEIHEKKGYSNLSITKHINEKISQQDENLIREIVYGILENQLYIDYIISKSSKIKVNKIHPAILEIIRIGIYQIAFMDRIPNSAAVNESVNLAKKYGHKGTVGFVNGILRSISRDQGILTIDVKDEIKYFSIKYSHSEDLVKRFIKDFGSKFTEELLKANNSKPLLNIRVNTLKIDKDALKRKLEEKGFIISFGQFANDALIVHNPVRITNLDEFKNGEFTIQDESSMLVGQLLEPKEGALVLDLCSAPGGKSTHIGQYMKNKGLIISRDIFAHKIKLIESNAKRLGINIIKTEVFDALDLDKDLLEKVDYLLVDAPCSGLGLIRRKPEIKWNRTSDDIDDLARLQENILEVAKHYVKKGGVLIYSTCTILDQENKALVEKFLANNRNFKPVVLDDPNLNNKFETLNEGYIQLYPNKHNTDGFFIAKMIKEG